MSRIGAVRGISISGCLTLPIARAAVQRGGQRDSIGVCGFGADERPQFRIVQLQRGLPQIAHFEHFVEGIDEGRG